LQRCIWSHTNTEGKKIKEGENHSFQDTQRSAGIVPVGATAPSEFSYGLPNKAVVEDNAFLPAGVKAAVLEMKDRTRASFMITISVTKPDSKYCDL
jgi:hypothetical protein